uniref:GDSL esterase/lipase n=1 Tax=Quercus lobata TaxID=97700 RepID=A0A7N2LPB1_QUELO
MLQSLYDYGARKMVLFGIGQIGCSPSELAQNSPDGFKVTNAGCCGVGRNNGQITCLPLQTPCQNRYEYLFWDAYHPTEAGSAIVAKRAYSAQAASDAYPVDIRRLAQI